MSKFYECKKCGNMVAMIYESGVKMVCCNEEMHEIPENTSDGASEKHVPEVVTEGNLVNVQIGSVKHPMLDEHHIEWVWVETENGSQMKTLHPEQAPYAQFILKDDMPVAVYEYCNIHGLWKKDF